ncbi:hypothetical protein N9138_01005 [bacterium]|nr:hypothetical protein [bacterium]
MNQYFINNQKMETEAYRQELKFIEQTIALNDFKLFLTIRDTRPKETNKAFRMTDEAGGGYLNRERVFDKLIAIFRQAYGLRGGKNPDFFWFAIHESGVSRKHFLKEDCGHLHVGIGFKKHSKFYDHPTAHLEKFVLKVKGASKNQSPTGERILGAFSWCDFCSSLANKDKNYLIQNQAAVANYMAKPEIGTIRGGCFSKRPFWSENLPKLPSDKDLVLEPLGVM